MVQDWQGNVVSEQGPVGVVKAPADPVFRIGQSVRCCRDQSRVPGAFAYMVGLSGVVRGVPDWMPGNARAIRVEFENGETWYMRPSELEAI